MILTPGAAPIWLTKNYFSADADLRGGTFSTTSMGGIGKRLYDMDPFAYGLSAGSSEGTHEIIISQLYEGYALAQRVVGLLALLNTNIANFTVYASTDGGVTWPTTLATVAGNTAVNYVLDLSASPVTMNAIKIDITNTIGAVNEKQVGTVVLCGVLFQPARPPDKMKRKYRDNQRIVVMADGSKDVTYIKRSPASHEFYGCQMPWSFMSDSDRDALRAVRRANPSCCLYPEPGDRAGDLFYGKFTGDWGDEPTSQWKGAGNSLAVDFEETSS